MFRLIMLCALLFFPMTLRAEVKIIELQHRAASEIADQIREILKEGEQILSAGPVLVIDANGESLQAAEKLADILDRPPVQLIVRIRHLTQQQQAAEKKEGVIYYGTDKSLSAQGSDARHIGNSRQQVEQSLLVQEGGSGWLEIGKDIPYTREWAVLSGDISGYSEQTAYKEVATGFQVYPIQVVGEKVLIAIQSGIMDASGTPNPPTINFSQTQSRVYLPLGEWVELGSQLQQSDRFGRAVISRSARGDQTERALFIRIDVAEGFSP